MPIARIRFRKKVFPAPYAGDPLPLGFNAYSGGDIKVKFGEHLTIFKVVDGKIGGYKGFVISQDKVKQAEVSLKLSDGKSVLLEGDINKGGKRLSISLTNDGSWVQDIDKNPGLRDKLYRSLVANNQSNEWSKVVNSLISAGFGNITISAFRSVPFMNLIPKSVYLPSKSNCFNFI